MNRVISVSVYQLCRPFCLVDFFVELFASQHFQPTLPCYGGCIDAGYLQSKWIHFSLSLCHAPWPIQQHLNYSLCLFCPFSRWTRRSFGLRFINESSMCFRIKNFMNHSSACKFTNEFINKYFRKACVPLPKKSILSN